MYCVTAQKQNKNMRFVAHNQPMLSTASLDHCNNANDNSFLGRIDQSACSACRRGRYRRPRRRVYRHKVQNGQIQMRTTSFGWEQTNAPLLMNPERPKGERDARFRPTPNMFGAQAGAKKNIRAQLQIHTDAALRAAWSELCGLFRQTKTCHPMHVYSSPRFHPWTCTVAGRWIHM
jgi:hypothetical protein